jgi:hypothetical protein
MNDSISRRVTEGDKSESPWVIVRIPAGSCSDATSFEQEAAGLCDERGDDVFIAVEGGEDQYPRRMAGGHDPPGRLQTVDSGHPDVHQHDARPVRLAASTACAPSWASAMTCSWGLVSRIILNPARAGAWSSAIRMLTSTLDSQRLLTVGCTPSRSPVGLIPRSGRGKRVWRFLRPRGTGGCASVS